MKNILKGIGWIGLFLAVIFAIDWIVTGNDFFMYKYWAPKQENVRRQVFEGTKSYNQGMVQELQNMQFEYAKADSAGKEAMASIILHRAADYDENQMPTDLYNFIQKLKNERNNPKKY